MMSLHLLLLRMPPRAKRKAAKGSEDGGGEHLQHHSMRPRLLPRRPQPPQPRSRQASGRGGSRGMRRRRRKRRRTRRPPWTWTPRTTLRCSARSCRSSRCRWTTRTTRRMCVAHPSRPPPRAHAPAAADARRAGRAGGQVQGGGAQERGQCRGRILAGAAGSVSRGLRDGYGKGGNTRPSLPAAPLRRPAAGRGGLDGGAGRGPQGGGCDREPPVAGSQARY